MLRSHSLNFWSSSPSSQFSLRFCWPQLVKPKQKRKKLSAMAIFINQDSVCKISSQTITAILLVAAKDTQIVTIPEVGFISWKLADLAFPIPLQTFLKQVCGVAHQ